jgi:hypothetical protein
MDMPSELSKYIQDFIRPHKPTTQDIDVIYDYFVELERIMREQFCYKVGMMISIKERLYQIIKTTDKYSMLMNSKGVVRRYQNTTLRISRIENKTIFVKRYIRTSNMMKLTWRYLCGGKDPFHKMIILKKYNKFWTSYI